MNKEKLLYERALITCVVMLFVCIVLKIFGVEWFNLDTSIPLLNKIDEIVMNSEVLSFLYSLIFSSINAVFMVLVASRCKVSFILKKLYIVIPCVILMMCIKRFVYKGDLSLLIDFFILYVIYKATTNSSSKEFIITVILNILYQYISLCIRNMGIHYAYYGLVSGVVFMLDYYIMMILTYSYLKKGDKTLCGIFRVSFSYLRTKLWKKHSQSSNPCSDKG